MPVTVVYASFTFAVSAFGVWLVVMLRQDRAHRYGFAAESQERIRAHRRAALAARYAPTAATGPATTRPTATVVARAGTFCRVPGNVGYTKAGDRLVCEASGAGRPRWRRADLLEMAG
jgi:hypothetical protein